MKNSQKVPTLRLRNRFKKLSVVKPRKEKN